MPSENPIIILASTSHSNASVKNKFINDICHLDAFMTESLQGTSFSPCALKKIPF